MPAPDQRSRTSSSRRLWVLLLVIASSCGLTIFAAYYASRAVRLKEREQFQSAVLQVEGALQTRMESYVALLRGGVGLMAAEPRVTREQFKLFYERLQVPEHYPGIQGIGFTLRVLAGHEAEVIAAARRDGLTNFHIWPTQTGTDSHTIFYLEPGDKRNQAALGYNMFSEPVRQKAMQQACDLGTATASGRVKLVQEIEGRVQAGFLIYVPVYKGGSVPSSVEERRKSLVGFVYSPFRADDLFDSMIPTNAVSSLEIEIFDGADPAVDNLLHKSAPQRERSEVGRRPLEATSTIDVASHAWTMRFRWAQEGLRSRMLPPLILLVGAMLTALITYLMVSEAGARRKAEESNEQLRRSEQSLKEARAGLEEHARELERRVEERTALLQESIRDLEAVLYHVAHDLRAPVRAMGSFASILKEDYAQRLDDRANGYLNRISEGASRMDRLVSDLLSYGRLAQMALPAEVVQLEKSLEIVLREKEREIIQKGCKIEVQRPLPAVKANARALTEVMSHLVDNALKFSWPDKAPEVQIWADNGEFVRLNFKDNGIGVRPEYHERIFRVFEKLHSHTTYPGTGIGLAIARKAMDRMGGRVGIESKSDQGSTFWIELPKG